MSKSQKIDVWHLIQKTINAFPAVYSLAFLGIYAYSQSYRAMGQSLAIPVSELKLWNKKIERKIRKVLKQNGANLKYVSDTHDINYIFEVIENIEQEGDNE